MKPQTSSSGSHTIWPEEEKNPPGSHKRLPFLTIHRFHPVNFPDAWAHFAAVQSRRGGKRVRVEMELCGMALCLETASLQRWKCETLIDHFNWKPFVLRATEVLRANAPVNEFFNVISQLLRG